VVYAAGGGVWAVEGGGVEGGGVEGGGVECAAHPLGRGPHLPRHTITRRGPE